MAVLKAVNAGLLDSLPLEQVADAERIIRERVLENLPRLCKRMESGEEIDDQEWERLLDEARDAISGLDDTEE